MRYTPKGSSNPIGHLLRGHKHLDLCRYLAISHNLLICTEYIVKAKNKGARYLAQWVRHTLALIKKWEAINEKTTTHIICCSLC